MFRRILCALLALLLGLSGFALAEELLDEYEMVSKLSADRYLVRADGLWGVVDAAGKVVLEPKLREEPVFADGCAVASVLSDTITRDFSGIEERAKLYGVIDDAGEVRIPFEYDRIEIAEGVALVSDDEGYRFLKLDGSPLNGETYFRAEPFVGGYAAVGVKIETADENILSDPYDALWGAIDSAGKQIIPCEYERIYLSDSGPALACVDDGAGGHKYGYLGMDGKFVLPPEYDSAYPFRHGIAAVCKYAEAPQNDSEPNIALWGAIDPEGNVLLPLQYDDVSVLDDGTIQARQDNHFLTFTLDAGGKAVQAGD